MLLGFTLHPSVFFPRACSPVTCKVDAMGQWEGRAITNAEANGSLKQMVAALQEQAQADRFAHAEELRKAASDAAAQRRALEDEVAALRAEGAAARDAALVGGAFGGAAGLAREREALIVARRELEAYRAKVCRGARFLMMRASVHYLFLLCLVFLFALRCC